jgi:hypothetical protein
VIQTLVERPTAGGDRFAATIGASRLGRRVTQGLLLGALALIGTGTIVARAGGPGIAMVGLGGFLLALSVAAGVLSGGTETLVCENGTLSYRRVGVLRERRMAIATTELRKIHNLAGGRFRFEGVRLETRSASCTVGRRLSARDAGDLVWMLQHHLSLLDPAPVPSARPRPVPSGPARANARDELRARNLPTR